ncbi:DUF2480 family protein [Empedobacter sp. UBA7494]|uniref:DUF2480 family protein n=1 Tax=Empedobacter sp. UBA7494 TaxID=1946450 RepID=UPI0025BE4030|nr:DUF2480 family protein [Empedobacter sp. UBA7494]
MSDEIINKVANSSLVTIDLQDYYPDGDRVVFDLKDWLYEELILREKDFRENLKNHDWTQYQDKYVALTCTADAIVPSWAYLLVATYLSPIAKRIVHGSLQDLDTILYTEIVDHLPYEDYVDGKIIVKGCSHKPVPESAYIQLIERLQPIVSSLMFGEACSTVPLYKKNK